jgi:predicted nucleic acid-binding protein
MRRLKPQKVIKRRRITADRGNEFLVQLATLNFVVDEPPPIAYLPISHSLASDRHLTAYDAAYLDLAKRRSLPLATLDGALTRAAIAEGVKIL